MIDKKKKPVLTLIAVPEDGGKVRRLQLSSRALTITLSLCAAMFVLASLLFMDYLSTKFDYIHLQHQHDQTLDTNVKLLRAKQYQEAKLDALSGRMGSITGKLKKMADIDSSIRELTNIAPSDIEPVESGIGGQWEEASNQTERLDSMNQRLDTLTEQADNRLGSLKSLKKELAEYEGALVSVPSVWPVRGWVSSEFGYRTSPFTGKRAFHHGIDIATPSGTPIIAPANAFVEFVGVKGGYGNVVTLRHGGGLITLYGHLKASLVAEGQAVRRGQKIALVGNTGRSTGPHVHYEIRLNDVPVNPRRYILY